jgi:hypothetical protein
VTVAFASATPLITGVLVLLGLVPVNVGTLGSTVSTTKVIGVLAALIFPAKSLAVAVST